jgi:hypothetical protein
MLFCGLGQRVDIENIVDLSPDEENGRRASERVGSLFQSMELPLPGYFYDAKPKKLENVVLLVLNYNTDQTIVKSSSNVAM